MRFRSILTTIYSISGFRYLPREDGSTNGCIGQYEFYVSLDGVNWGTVVATGTLPNTALETQCCLIPRAAASFDGGQRPTLHLDGRT